MRPNITTIIVLGLAFALVVMLWLARTGKFDLDSLQNRNLSSGSKARGDIFFQDSVSKPRKRISDEDWVAGAAAIVVTRFSWEEGIQKSLIETIYSRSDFWTSKLKVGTDVLEFISMKGRTWAGDGQVVQFKEGKETASSWTGHEFGRLSGVGMTLESYGIMIRDVWERGYEPPLHEIEDPGIEAESSPPIAVGDLIAVEVLGVRTPASQFIDVSTDFRKQQLLEPDDGARLIHVMLGITPRGASDRFPRELGVSSAIISGVYRKGDWLFVSPFGKLQTPTGTSSSLAVVGEHTWVVSGEGSTKIALGMTGDTVSATLSTDEGMPISVYSLAVNKQSIVTLGFMVPITYTRGVLQIEGHDDIEFELGADWGDW